jgi:16S rRNA (cytosine1402-N4)-methyltransferase
MTPDHADPHSTHAPVMPREVRSFLADVDPPLVVDCTLGLGGHAEILLLASEKLHVIGLDCDPANIQHATSRLDRFKSRLRVIQANFADLRSILNELAVDRVGGILADLGVSSNQIANPLKGLSFDIDGPLDMRLDPALPRTAADLVNSLPEGELADLLYLQSQERHSRRIAKRICQARRHGRLNSTVALARLIASAVGDNPDSPRGRIHPATRTFMALRISVNRELHSLSQLLAQAPQCLSVGGVMTVISFHSMEDRLVKEDFRRRKTEGTYDVLTRKPLVADEIEIAANPRSRSAKLRAARLIQSP